MPDKLGIFNRALLDLGEPAISDPEEDVERAAKLRAIYDEVRDEVQAAHPWNACMSRAVLAQSVQAPVWGWRYSYPLPTNPWCLRAWEILSQTCRWEVEGRALVADTGPPLSLRYIARVETEALWSPQLARAVSLKLASDLAYGATDSRATAEALEKRYLAMISFGASLDAQEGTPEDVADSDLELVRR